MSKSTVVAKAGFREMFTDILLNNIYIYIYLFISLITSEKPLMAVILTSLLFSLTFVFFMLIMMVYSVCDFCKQFFQVLPGVLLINQELH